MTAEEKIAALHAATQRGESAAARVAAAKQRIDAARAAVLLVFDEATVTEMTTALEEAYHALLEANDIAAEVAILLHVPKGEPS